MNSGRILSLALSVILCLVALGALLIQAENSTYAQDEAVYVAPSGSDIGGCRNPNAPCRTVQYAVDQAYYFDAVKVATGVYTGVHSVDSSSGGVVTQVVFISYSSLVIQGGYTTDDWNNPDPDINPTILDAEGQGRAIYMEYSDGSSVEGFQIVRGDGYRGGGDVGDMIYGRGGGVFIYDSAATIRNNQIISNTALDGGGLYYRVNYWPYPNSITVTRNLISGNLASHGGGIYLRECDAVVNWNAVTNNSAGGDGGGIWADHSDVVLVANTIANNSAVGDGGGGYLWNNDDVSVTHNTIVGNTAEGDGGGLIADGLSVLSQNRIIGNDAGDQGGGIYLGAHDTAIRNVICNNTSHFGGGVFSWGGGEWSNNIIARNHGSISGGGLYLEMSSLRLLHSTIAENSGGDGTGIYVTDFSGASSSIVLTNTILAGHAVGIYVDGGQWVIDSEARLESTLWHGNGMNWDGEGVILHNNDYTGDPAFADPNADDYHIGLSSAAIDTGVNAGILLDIDDQPRPGGAGYDIGADEYWLLWQVYLPVVWRSAP